MIKYAKDIVKEINKRDTIKIPNNCVTGEEFEKWLYEEDTKLKLKEFVMEEIIYFELNHWGFGTYPENVEPFESWMSDYYETPEEEEKSWIRPGKVMDKWYKDNELCAVVTTIDMSVNFCITAKKSWVEKNCPELLTKYTEFLVKPDEYGDIEGRFGNHFVEWSKENIGLWYDYEKEDSQGYLYYELKRYDEE